MGKNAHEAIEKIKSGYLSAYAARWGQAAADRLTISYRAGWWYLTASPLSTPYRAKEIIRLMENLLEQAKKANRKDAGPSPPPAS